MKTTLCNEWFTSKRARLLRGSGLLLLSLIIAGCPAAKPDKVVIRGSNTVGEELAPRLIAAYRKGHPGVAFDLESKGTGYGFGNLLVGSCDIAAASREANPNELALAKDRGVAMNGYLIGSYSVEVIVNPGNAVENLTRDQVEDIFTGKATNWKDVGGSDAPIHLYIRDPISGTYLGFRELTMENKLYALEEKTFTNYLGIIRAVAKDPNGIGYAGISSDPSEKAGVKAVSIEGIAPSYETVNNGKYPYRRALHFYTNKEKESPAALDFIQFVMSPAGQSLLSEMGYVPHP